MDAPVYKKLLDIANQRENPFSTPIGQDVVSISETFWHRLAREGKFRSNHWDKVAFGATTSWLWSWNVSAEAGFKYYPKLIILSADVDCQLGIQVKTGLETTAGTNADSIPTFTAFVKAGTPLIVPFDGDLYAFDTTSSSSYPAVNIGVNNTAAGNLYATIHGIEVAYND